MGGSRRRTFAHGQDSWVFEDGGRRRGILVDGFDELGDFGGVDGELGDVFSVGGAGYWVLKLATRRWRGGWEEGRDGGV